MVLRRHVIAGLGGLAASISMPRLARPAQGTINAAQSGLIPNAAHDQTEAFNALLRTAGATGAQLFLPSGIYIVSGLRFPAYVNLLGLTGQSRIKLGGTGYLARASGSDHVQISGLVLDGNNQPLAKNARGLIEAANVGRFVIDDCDIVSARGNAIDLYQCAGRIENTRLSSAENMAIFIADATGMRVTGNEINDCGNGGIVIHRYEAGADGTIIHGNRIGKIRADLKGTGEYGNGINVYQANNVVVSGNVIDSCAFTAIRANSASNLKITGNNCTASGETAIYAEFAFEGAAIGNNIVDGAANGISIVNFDKGGRLGTCTGNIVRNLSVKGPYEAVFGVGIAAEADTAITGNVVENAPTYGIQLGWGPYMRNLIASDNVIRNAGEGICVSVVEGTGAAIIRGNLIQGATKGGIVGHRWSAIAVDDLTRKGSAYPNLVVEQNIIRVRAH